MPCFGKLVDEDLTAAGKARLNESLQIGPEVRDYYSEYLDLHGALEEHIGIPDFSSLNAVIDPDTKEESKPASIHFGNWGWAVAAALVIGVVHLNFLGSKRKKEPELPIAQITKLSGPLLWTGDGGQVNRNLKVGSPLFGGTIEGMAPDAWLELECNDGSQVVISGNSMLTISDLGQKELRPEGREFLRQRRSTTQRQAHARAHAAPPCLRSWVRDSAWMPNCPSSTLTVNEGKVRATRLSDGSTVEVAAKHAGRHCHGIANSYPKKMPDSVTLWQSHLENGIKRNYGEWMPARGAEPAHLKTVPLTLPAKDDRKAKNHSHLEHAGFSAATIRR